MIPSTAIPTAIDRWLIEPCKAIRDQDQRRSARSLASLSLVLLTAVLISALRSLHPALIAASLVVSLGYLLARTRLFEYAAFIIALTTAAPSFWVAAHAASGDFVAITAAFLWIPLALILGGLWLRWQVNLALIGLLALALLVLTQLQPWLLRNASLAISQMASMLLVGGLLTSLASWRQERATREIRRQREALERQACELQRSVEQLELARRDAETVSRLKSEFLAVVSHELRTPLNAIVGYADFLLEDPDSGLAGKYRDYMERILQNGERQSALVDDLLDLSMIEANQVQICLASCDLRTLIGRVFQDHTSEAARKGLAIEYIDDPTMPALILADNGRIAQIVENLLSNALKFTEHGYVRVALRNIDDSRFEISVSDSGIGIAAELQRLIFEPFRQGDASSGRRYPGSGLGLSIVQRLTDLMGGQVRVVSEPGKGSCFCVTLPLLLPSDP